MSDHLGEVTVLLRAVQAGKPGAVNELIGLIYGELRLIAQRQPGLQHLKDAPQATALVHEAYLRLFDKETTTWEDRHHFFWAASRAMRDILVEEARRFSAQKRGGDRKRVDLSENLTVGEESEQLIELDRLFDQLAGAFPDAAEVFLLHFFGGLTHQMIADLLGKSLATIRRRWTLARAWLHRELLPAIDPNFEAYPVSATANSLRLE